MFVSVTRLRLRRWSTIPIFMYRSNLCIKQAASDERCKYVATIFDRNLVFWTVTVWDAPKSMYHYLGTGAHLKAMPHLREWCSEAATAHETDVHLKSPPSVKFCEELIHRAAKFSTVLNPSTNQLAMHIESAQPYFVTAAKNLLSKGEL